MFSHSGERSSVMARAPGPGIKIAAAGTAEPPADQADPWNVGSEGCEQLHEKSVSVSVGAGALVGGPAGTPTV
ncbi:hypothetical protein MDA_GLEAN10016438 [Myotis davidii]|uniref:Uncharacterized protein n=1 Tax=Myotis davidii TaxID=225400 RepID=L5M889_MYODS|nr:hypothetical protein MDA_GLEAN10016438 [Myotis davidii]